MNLKELREKPREWKVLDNTSYNIEATKEMIGGIFEERAYCNYDKTVSLYNKDKSDFWNFDLSDLQEMTPLEYNGVRIGIGDEVNWCGRWCEVYGYSWFGGEWRVSTAKNKNYSSTCFLAEYDISDHKPLHSKKEPLELTLDQIAEKFGVEAVKIKK